MKASNVVLLLAGAAALWFGRPAGGFFHKNVAPALAFTDASGKPRSLHAPERPTVVLLWVEPCAYCERAFQVLDQVRPLYNEKDLDIVAFYLNPAEDAQVAAMAGSHSVSAARGQPTGDFLTALLDGLAFRGTGRDLYVIGTDGRYETVDSSDLSVPAAVTAGKLRELLKTGFKLKERS